MIRQNTSTAVSVKEKINLHRTTDLDSLKIFEELTKDELKELFLYCTYPPEDKGSLDPLPSSKLFPHNLAFVHSHPRDSMGSLYDTRAHLKLCIDFEKSSADLRKKVHEAANELFREVIQNTSENIEILGEIIRAFLSMHFIFDHLLIEVELLGVCIARTDLPPHVRHSSAAHIHVTPRHMCEPTSSFLLELVRKEKNSVAIGVIRALTDRGEYTSAIKCLTYLDEWFGEMHESIVSEALILCTSRLRGNSYINDTKVPSASGRAIDWFIYTIKQCHASVQIGFAKLVKVYLIDPRFSDEELAAWIKGDIIRHGIGPNCLLYGGEDALKLHEAMDKILSEEKAATH